MIIIVFLFLDCILASHWKELKNQTSITFGLIGAYSLLPGLVYNGSQVIGGLDALNLTILGDTSLWGLDSFFFWNQVASEIAVNAVNNDPTTLPYTTIKIKRFNNFDADRVGHSGGHAVATAFEIAENHKDVVAVIGNLYSGTMRVDGEVYSTYQIPECVGTSSSPVLTNRNMYPYLIQAQTIMGLGETMALLFKSWNVKKIVFITQTDINSRNSQSRLVKEVLQKQSIIISTLNKVDGNLISYVVQCLATFDARYFYIDGDGAFIAQIYYSLAVRRKFVGPKYVWLASNLPWPSDDPVKRWGKNYYKLSRGIILPYVLNIPSEYSTELLNNMTQAVDEIQKPWGVQFSPVDAANGYNMNFLYDCVRLLAAGMNKILNDSSTTPSILQSTKFRAMLNSTLFEDTGYRGMIGDPVRLTKGGDVASIGQVAFVDGTSDFNVIPFAYTDMAISRLFKVNGTPPMFFDGTATPPLDGTIILTEKIISQSSVYGKLLLSLAIVGLSMVVLFLIFLVVAQSMPLFHTTSIPFLTTLTIGTAVSFISNLFYFGVESVGNCEMRIWFQVTAFSMIVGSIICRNAKVIFVYNSSQRLKQWTVNDSTWMIPLLGIVIIEQILLVVWFRLSNVSIKSLVTNDTIQYACTCGFYGPTYALVVYNSVLVVSLFSIAYYTVDVPVVNSEFTLILIFSIMTCIFAILSLIMNQSFTSETTKQINIAILIWILTISPLSMQFIPRALEMYGDRQRTSLYKIMFRPVGSTTSSQQQTSQLSSQLRSFSTPIDNRTTMSTISRGDVGKVDTVDQIKSSDLRTGQYRTIVSSFVQPTNSLPRKQVSSGVTSLMLIPAFDAVISVSNFGFSGSWHRGIVFMVNVSNRTYIQFLPTKEELQGTPRVFAFHATRSKLIPVKFQDDSGARFKLTMGSKTVLLDFISTSHGNEFDELLKRNLEIK